MRLLLCVFCFVFASVYSSTTAQDVPVEVCISFGGETLVDPYINVDWNFPDDEVNIMFGQNGVTDGVYNKSSAVDISLASNRQQESINVTVCRLNASSCYSVITAIADNPLYNVTWTRVNNTTVEFTCEVACRTPITGCNINLDSSHDGANKGFGSSDIVNGSADAISSRFITVVINDIEPTEDCTYTANAVAIVDGLSLSFNSLSGIIPAAVQVPDTTGQISSTMMSTTPVPSDTSLTTRTSAMVGMTSMAVSTTTLAATPVSVPMSSSVTSNMPSTPGVGAANEDSDDDDDEYLPVIIAASCACVLLLIVAIILLIIIIRVKRRSSGSNLSSPSASKVNNYDDLRDVKYFPMLDSQSNLQKSQSPPSDTQNQNQEAHVTKASEYDFPVFTSVEHNPQVTGYDSLSAKDAKYDNPNGILNPTSQSNGPPVDNLYDPLTLESVTQPDDAPKSPVVDYDKLMHSPTPQATTFPPSIYDTLSEKNLRAHYEFPDRTDENGMVESKTELRRVASSNGDEYTVPHSS